VPLKVTIVAPVKLEPVSVTSVPVGPSNGEKELIVGETQPAHGLMVKLTPLLDAPPTVTTTV
jgi:hypothetical protein